MARALCRLARLRVLWRRDSPAMGDGSHLTSAAEAAAAGHLLHFDHRLFNVVRYVCDDAFPPDRDPWPRPYLHRRPVPRRPREDDGPRARRHRRHGGRAHHAFRAGEPDAARAAGRHRDPRLRQGRADLGGLHRHPRPLPADADDRGLRRAAARLAEPVHLPGRAEIRRQGLCPQRRPHLPAREPAQRRHHELRLLHRPSAFGRRAVRGGRDARPPARRRARC